MQRFDDSRNRDAHGTAAAHRASQCQCESTAKAPPGSAAQPLPNSDPSSLVSLTASTVAGVSA